VREREERRLRRMPDFLPVSLQNELRHSKSELREQKQIRILKRRRKAAF
jgi:hypothetical protein